MQQPDYACDHMYRYQTLLHMKTTCSFVLLALSVLLSKAQCPVITGVIQNDTGSGSYHLDLIIDNPQNMITTYTWFYYPTSGTGGMGGYAYFPDPGTYPVTITAYFDDPNTTQPDDCLAIFEYEAIIICDAVEVDYPVVNVDDQNNQFDVVASVTGGSQPYTYNWTVDANYVDNGDGNIIIPFTDAGYMLGDVVVVDANGCFTWPHSFGGINPLAQCELNVDMVEMDGAVQITIDYNLGTSDVAYPMYTVNYGDGTSESFFDQNVISHTYSTPGEYEICVDATNELGNCADDYCETMIIGLSAGTKEESSKDWSVYPNPSSGLVNIKAERGAFVTVLDATGRMLHSEMLRDYDMMNLQLPSGCYFIKLENGSSTEIRNLIVR